MTTYTVGTTPQAIYPDGHNDAFAITNNGPWTVLIDDVSSIGVGSYEVPPLASIPWDAHRPLWIQAKPGPVTPAANVSSYRNATVRITRQTDVIQPRGSATVLLCKASSNTPFVQGRFNVMETSTYSSIIVNVLSALNSNYVAMPTASNNLLDVFWYPAPDADAPSLVETYNFPQLENVGGVAISPARFVLPVLDAYCQLTLRDSDALVQSIFELEVYGIVAPLAKSIQYWVRNSAGGDLPARDDRVILPDLRGPDLAAWDNWYTAGLANQINVSPMTNRLTIATRSVGIVGGTTLVIEMVPWVAALPAAGNFIAEMTIPAGASVVRQELDIPFASPIRIRTAYAGAGNIRLSLIWS